MSSVIVVNNDLKDSIQEYAQIIDGATGNTDLSKAVDAHLPKTLDQAEITNKEELVQKIKAASSKETLAKLTDKEFEPTIYLLIHILALLSSMEAVLDDESSPIYKLILDINPTQPLSIRDRKSIKSSSILSILSTIFNLLPSASKVRVSVLKTILNVLKTSGVDFQSVEDNLGANIVNWLKSSQAQDSEIETIFWEFINLDTFFSQKSLQLIKEFTHVYPVSANELNQLIEFALRSKVVDVSFLVNNNVAEALKKALSSSSDALPQLFSKYVKGELIAVDDIPSNLPKEFIYQKSKILSLAKFFAENSTQSSEHNQIIFTYKEIPLVSNHLEFEELLIEAIKAGVIEGKLNQIDETFNLSRVNRFIIAGDDTAIAQGWESIRQALQQWSLSLNNVDEIVRQTREQIVNGGSN